jgi:hypothetical protein
LLPSALKAAKNQSQGLFDKMPHFTLPFAPKGTFTLALMKCPSLPCPFAKMPRLDEFLVLVQIIFS